LSSLVLRPATFVTFDGSLSVTTMHQRPDRYRHLEIDAGRTHRIARGGGYSYAPASFGAGIVVQEMGSFNRFLEFDGKETVKVEAGMTLDKLTNWAGRRRLYLPVLPGYPIITVGGCIAADVHGKNPWRDGTFSEWVLALTLYHPARGFHSVTRELQPDLFDATCGGFGLTGLIVDATLRLIPLPSTHVDVDRTALTSLKDTRDALIECGNRDFAYSWHDGTARGRSFGRGVLFRGDWADDESDWQSLSYRPMSAAGRGRIPLSLWNRFTAKAANAAFLSLTTRQKECRKDFLDAMFPFARQRGYHRLYGRPGLAEAQLLVPDSSFTHFDLSLAKLVDRLDPTMIMMSTKRFRGRQRSCTPTGVGTLVAMDFVQSDGTKVFLRELDALTIDVGAQPNIAKDSRLPVDVAKSTLPYYESFRRRVQRFDPDSLYQSAMARRLELCVT